jgi:hypothetical protein
MSPEARERSFDELARGLASGSISRGRALRLMGAALLGGTLASLGIGGVATADDECKPLEKKCRKNQQCCSGNCSKSGTSRFGTCACQENGGSCANNSQCCSGNCASGTCAAACLPDVIRGNCTSPCTSDTQCCSGNCRGCCIGRNGVTCRCQNGTFSTCTSVDCSDATAVNQFCDVACQGQFGSAGGGHTCTPNGCLPG